MNLNRKFRSYLLAALLSLILFILSDGFSFAAGSKNSVTPCSVMEFQRIEADFRRMTEIRALYPDIFSDADYKAAALTYISGADGCFQAAMSANIPATSQNHTDPILIDTGGAWALNPDGSQNSDDYTSYGTKWGDGSSFTGGQNAPGPGLPGGTVTYSYMANGVSHLIAENKLTGNVDVRTGLGVDNCVQDEIALAFAAWSAVADIQFVEVADNGLPSNLAGAQGDIRIGAHDFDGAYGTLAHAYYPPPNGTTIAGDLHFDSEETWSCTPAGGIDIGIVALHEIGHSIGLRHSYSGLAVMNPSYNASLTGLQTDDVEGAVSIYGSSNPLVVNDVLLVSDSASSDSTTITYQFTIQNQNSNPVEDITVSASLPESASYIPGTATAEPSIPLNGFPETSTLPFTIDGQSEVTIRFALEADAAKRGEQFIISITVRGPTLGQDLMASEAVTVNPFLSYVPLLMKSY